MESHSLNVHLQLFHQSPNLLLFLLLSFTLGLQATNTLVGMFGWAGLSKSCQVANAISTQISTGSTEELLMVEIVLFIRALRIYDFPIPVNWTSPFPLKGCCVVHFIFIPILKEHSVSKQWRKMIITILNQKNL